MLVKGELSRRLQNFILELQTKETKVEDSNKRIIEFCDNLENEIYLTNKQITIIIPTGSIQVQGAGPTGPITCTNLSPITLNNIVQ